MRKLSALLFVIACGDDGNRHTPDATPHDGPAIDGMADAAQPQPVTITTIASGTPNPGVHVYFLNADSSVVLATTTDAQGTASAVMAAGGSVTAIDPYRTGQAFGGFNDELYTFMSVKPGDHLRLASSPAPTTITVTATMPVDSNGSAASYEIDSPCGTASATPGGSGAPATTPLTLSNCGATTDFLVVARDANGAALDYFFMPNVAVADAGTVSFPGATYTAAATRTYTLQNAPLGTIQLSDQLVDANHGVYFRSTTTSNGSASLAMPDFTGAKSIVNYNFYPGGDSRYTMLEWGPYTATYTTDVAARELAVFQGSPTYDVASHSIGMQEGSGATPDFILVQLDANRSNAHTWAWHIVAPQANTTIVPVLPTDVYDFNVGSGDNGYVQSYTAGKVTGGYDAVRAYLLSMDGGTNGATLGASGTATLEDFVLAFSGKPAVLQHRTH
ncbi:MAG: hypothetical protein JO257_27880 [Deltaproteobacteria bacterium]|nr:hypothetical protein [Deltaproteobacteria bacterium]